MRQAFSSSWLAVAFSVLAVASPPLRALGVEPQAAAPVAVRFEVNDALVKDKRIADVRITVARGEEPGRILGLTDGEGHLGAQLEPGEWKVSYRVAGYVPIDRSLVTVAEGTTVTATLSPLLEAIGEAGRRRVQLVLNWGSGPKSVMDVDAHFRCGCTGKAQVYFGNTSHRTETHSAELDVDDRDWGGPETITLLDPPPGAHEYWVTRYSTPPPQLGTSEVTVRVVFDDQVAGEYRVPADLDRRDWRPFKRLEIGADLTPRLVPFTPEELAAGADRSSLEEEDDGESDALGCCGGLATVAVMGLAVLGSIVSKLRRRVRR